MEQQAAAGLPPPGPWQEQTATTLLIVCRWQSSGTQRGFWRGAWCFGKQPLPPASRALLINVSLPLKTPLRSMVSTWLWSQALLQPQGREFTRDSAFYCGTEHRPCSGHRVPQPTVKGTLPQGATGQSQGCSHVLCGGN